MRHFRHFRSDNEDDEYNPVVWDEKEEDEKNKSPFVRCALRYQDKVAYLYIRDDDNDNNDIPARVPILASGFRRSARVANAQPV